MRKIKKLLTMTLIASTLLSTSVTAREIAPTVNKTNGIPSTVVEDMMTEANTETVTTATERIAKKEKKKEKITSTSNDTVNDKVKDAELDLIDEKEHVTKELLIKSDKESDLPSNGKILSSYNNTYLVSFNNENEAEKIYEDKNVDASLNIPFGVATENKPSETTVIEPDIFDNLEEAIKDNNKKDDSFKVTEEDYSIAVIDTGMPQNEKNVEFVSLLGDNGYDEHGHGTAMLQAIREQDKDAKILSIKALDKNGYGDAATIYAAIKYAIERKVDVINLSISGFATEGNKIIEDVVKEAVSNGIIVVGAAGNDNLPASVFIPGGIEEAIIVGACNGNNERRSFSNYGVTVDYYANASSTSQASAIVTGTISANKGDVKNLDDTFFKTPDLSIFDEELKRYHMPGMKTDDDIDETEPGDTKLTDEEWLIARLRAYLDYGGQLMVAADASTLLADGATTVITHTAGGTLSDLGNAAKDAHASVGCHTYVINKALYNPVNVSVSGWNDGTYGWFVSPPSGDYTVMWNGGGSTDTGSFLYYRITAADAGDHTIAGPVTLTFRDCVVDLNDGSIHDWIITLNQVRFSWGKTTNDYMSKRQDLVVMEFTDGFPQFVTGAPEDYTSTGCDAANEVWFTQSVSGATDGVLLTGFQELDIDHKFPVNSDNHTYEGVRIDDVATITGLGTPQIWVSDNTQLSIAPVTSPATNGVSNYPRGIALQSPSGGASSAIQGAFVMGIAATGATLKWQGARCQTDIGLALGDVITIPQSTITTYADFQDADGIYRNNVAVHSQTANVGTAYGYTYSGEYAGAYHNVAGTSGGTPNNNGTVSTTFTTTDQAFQLHVPRISFTYSFNPNKPSSATGNVTNMPDSITKLAGNYCGDYNRTPSLADYEFLGFYDTPATTGGNTYNPMEEMISNKTFYARWKPYYTYRFHDNKPANATSNVVNMPDNIRKLEGSVCGNYNRTPSLKGWIFKGFYDTSATSGGNLYNASEQMYSNKDFYARWEPMKYYVRYNGNGTTNFNENATEGMLDGEYHQNTVTGSTAYQIFTYDSAGDPLRENGFSRKGYDFVCWNTTAARTGTDRNPGYVKPANVNWINADGTDPSAMLDGSHTYPVVDLYSVWRQKLGTANLNVVSEETGNPVRNVVVSLKNTHTGVQVSIRTTDADGNAGATGTTGVTNLHWFPYSWNSVSVPAGYKSMQDVTLDINPANSNDNSFLNVDSSQILYMKHVKLTINSEVSDIIDGENAPNFMYHITGVDVAGVTHSYDVMVQTEERTGKGVNIAPVAAGAEEPYMFAGTYTVTQYDVSRYIPQTARNISNVTPVGKNANVNLKDNTTAEVLFPYTIKQYGGFSGVHSLLNQLTK